MSAHAFSFNAMDGSDMPLADYKGKVVLVVNTASQCGFTPQYESLEALYQTYKDQGFEVIGVPCNDFANQEPGDDQSIKEFVVEKYHVTFPLTAKTQVKGKDAHPFFQWASKKAGFIGSPKWNFHKYLIGKDGQFITWFSSMTSPESSKLEKAVTQALNSELPTTTAARSR